jgi:heavy metal translocating P-type ATPase
VSAGGTVASGWGARAGTDAAIAALAALGILAHLALGAAAPEAWSEAPLVLVLAAGGLPLVIRLALRALRGSFGSDFLAAVSICAAAALHQYLAGAMVVLMLSGGAALERYAVAEATAVLRALAGRVPTRAHRRSPTGLDDIAVGEIVPGDELAVLPHEICPVDGEVLEGHGSMDEAYLTGEPFLISKGPGAAVLSGAINGDAALVVRAARVAADSRYARIMRVMQEAEQRRPALRRLGDQLGAWYTPLALAIAASAWWWSGDPVRFLSVAVIATPCPLLIAIPVAIIGSISMAARRGVIVKDPAALEQLTLCRTMILDKTGTLTYGRPRLTSEIYAEGLSRRSVLPMVAALERYSRHPLAAPILTAAGDEGYALPNVDWIREEAGRGLCGRTDGRDVLVTSRHQAAGLATLPPAQATGLECVVLIDGHFAALFRFHDVARPESGGFIRHLGPRHGLERIMIVSGDRDVEVRRLAADVSVSQVHAGVSPEEKLAIVREETARARTIFIGDGVNDAPALMAATVGIALGQHSDITSEAARVVVVDSSLSTVDELMHLARRLRRIALQSAVGGMAASVVGMGVAAAGLLTPVAGAIAQELIDVAAVLNALRTARTPRVLSDFEVLLPHAREDLSLRNSPH